MKSHASEIFAADEAPQSKPTTFQNPNAEGIFEDPAETIVVPLSGGNICHFLLAHAETGFVAGYKFFTRQPRNLLTVLPGQLSQYCYVSRDSALSHAVELAVRFFIEHRPALERLAEWSRQNLNAEAIRQLQEYRDSSTVGSADPWRASGFGDMLNGEAGPSATEETRPDNAEPGEQLPPAELPPVAAAPSAANYAELPVSAIAPGGNPRKQRDPEKQRELVENLRTTPLLHPVVVRDLGEGREGKPDTKRYELIAGEGRWLAYQELGRETIEARVFRGVDQATALAWALVENLQRSDLNPMEEAEGFAELSRLGWTPARMAEQTGKEKRTIQRALGLLKLPDTVREMMRAGRLTARHGRELARWVSPQHFSNADGAEGFVPRPRVCEIIAEVVAENEISGRQLEEEPVPPQAIGALLAEKELAEIPFRYVTDVQNALPSERLEFFTLCSRQFTFDLEKWKALKRDIDKREREAEKARAEKAARRVESAKETGVGVSLSALKESKADHVALTGDLEIYADVLPEGIVARGIDPATKAEVWVCTEPAKLQELQQAVKQAEAEDDELKAEVLYVRALEELKKSKGPDLLCALLLTDLITEGLARLATEAAKEFKIKLPAGAPKEWGGVESVTWLMKLGAVNALKLVVGDRLIAAARVPHYSWSTDHLWWISRILRQPKLGLVRDDPKVRANLIRQVAEGMFEEDEKPAAPAPKKPAAKSAKKGGRK